MTALLHRAAPPQDGLELHAWSIGAPRLLAGCSTPGGSTSPPTWPPTVRCPAPTWNGS